MTPITEGAAFPDLPVRVLSDGAWRTVPAQELLTGRTVVFFGLPGAFTPTCSTAHVPRYVELLPALQAAGVDEVVCVSVNDPFVMKAWQRDQGAESLTFLADGNGTLTEALGLLVDKSDLGFGMRSWRYSLIARDGVVTNTFIEPQQPGDPYVVSDADSMLEHLTGAPSIRPAPGVCEIAV